MILCRLLLHYAETSPGKRSAPIVWRSFSSAAPLLPPVSASTSTLERGALLLLRRLAVLVQLVLMLLLATSVALGTYRLLRAAAAAGTASKVRHHAPFLLPSMVASTVFNWAHAWPGGRALR